MKIFIITGASGVGKTSLVENLESELKNDTYRFYKFDSIGVPSLKEMIDKFGSATNWQKAKTIEWIDKLIGINDNKSIIFEGQMRLDFIIKRFKFHNFENYKFVLLHCSNKKMKKRLIEKRKQPELVNKDMYNWLKFLREKAIETNIEIIDTSNLSEQETAYKFLKEVLKINTPHNKVQNGHSG